MSIDIISITHIGQVAKVWLSSYRVMLSQHDGKISYQENHPRVTLPNTTHIICCFMQSHFYT